MERVQVTGWKHGFLKISFIKLLRQSGVRQFTLAETKDIVDQILAGRTVSIDFHANEEAATFVRRSTELGAVTLAPTDITDTFDGKISNSEPTDARPLDSGEYQQIDPTSVSKEDIDSLAEAWLACWRLPMSSPERAKLQWIMTLEYDLLEDAPEMLWLLILTIQGKDQSHPIQGVLSAGPLEDLLSRHGRHFINRAQEHARKDPGFGKLLGGVWKSTIPEDIWLRVQAAWNRAGWDSIPE